MLQALKRREQAAITGLQQSTTANQVANQVSKSQQVSGSGILDPATAIPRSHLRTPVEYVGGGLIAGLVDRCGVRHGRRPGVGPAAPPRRCLAGAGGAGGRERGPGAGRGRLWRPGMRLVRSRAVAQAGSYVSGLVAESGVGSVGAGRGAGGR